MMSEPEFRFDYWNGRSREIRCLILDVDGVLTDGKLIYDNDGHCSRMFDIQDGFAIRLFREFVGPVAIISGKESAATRARAKELGIEQLRLGSKDKAADLADVLATLDCDASETAAMGDDWPDLPMLTKVGLAIAPANAAREVCEAVHWVTKKRGGDGAVREAIERILRGRGLWQEALARYGIRGTAELMAGERL